MKKQYIIPYMETVKIRTAHQILAGSGVQTGSAPGDEYNDNDVTFGRGFDGFDDDE
jgi:hypothetical protein